jgi:hypothetical protein
MLIRPKISETVSAVSFTGAGLFNIYTLLKSASVTQRDAGNMVGTENFVILVDLAARPM